MIFEMGSLNNFLPLSVSEGSVLHPVCMCARVHVCSYVCTCVCCVLCGCSPICLTILLLETECRLQVEHREGNCEHKTLHYPINTHTGGVIVLSLCVLCVRKL